MDRKILKDIILKGDLIDENRLRELEALSISSGTTFLDSIINGGYIKEEHLLPLLGEFFNLTWENIEKLELLDPACFFELPPSLKKETHFLPLYKENGFIVVAVSDPMEIEMLDTLRDSTGLDLKIILSTQAKINKVRERFKMGDTGKSSMEETLTQLKDESLDDRSLEDLANEAPIIKLVNLIMMQAISEGASDIHVEPYEHDAVVRYRVDGVLRETAKYPVAQYPAIISRIKIMADLNIAERRIPQDGRIALKVMDRAYDLRVAIIPVLHGEGVVMRILDKGSIMVDLEDLGFSPGLLVGFKEQISRPHGIILITGPTGSGKTTTLYAALSAIKSVETKIITIEDPVEYQLEGISQIHVNSKVGLTFAAGLRSILRFDPDVVMVGEIRDGETAEIAIRAALTGHLVFSTLHTNDAPSSVSRLTDMGIAPFLISSSVNAVLAQRLVRKICEYCKEESSLTESAKAFFDQADNPTPRTVYKGKGCDDCNNTGYSGRAGVHELYEITPEARELVNKKAPAELLREEARKRNMKFMRDDGILKIVRGITTVEEVMRITQEA